MFLNKWTIWSFHGIIFISDEREYYTMGKNASVIKLSNDDRIYLETQIRARTIQAQTVNRARILLLKADGMILSIIVGTYITKILVPMLLYPKLHNIAYV